MTEHTYGPGAEAIIEAVAAITGCSRARATALVKSGDRPTDLRGYTPAEIGHHLTPGQTARLVAALKLPAALAGADIWRRTLNRPATAADYMRAEIGGQPRECFVVLGLDSRQRPINLWTVGLGSIAQVDIHPRELFRPMMRAGVHSCILGHNHPSGEATASEADIELTNRMCEIGRLVGIPVLDHLIVTSGEHCSFAALGLMPAA